MREKKALNSIIKFMNDNARGWVIAIGVLLILSLMAIGIVWVIQDTLQRTVQPVQDVTGNLSTRVAEVLNPTPTILPDPITIVHDVRALARLETIQYTVEKVITAETGQGPLGFLFGDRLLLVAHGIVIAGVDLQKLTPEDLQVREGVLYVDLPEPEIFVATLDNEKTYVYDRETGVLRREAIDLESGARLAAEQEIARAALDDGILELARQNAESYLLRLILQIGYPDVIFVQPEQTPTPLVTPAQ